MSSTTPSTPMAPLPGELAAPSSRAREIAHRILQIFHGRTTVFFALFFVVGHVMAIIGKLTMEYVAFMGTLGSLVLLHSAKEDIWPSPFAGLSGPDKPQTPTNTAPGPQGATPG